jgi:hypothetical protein
MNSNSIINVSNIVSLSRGGGTQAGDGENIVSLGYNVGTRENWGDGSINLGYNEGMNVVQLGSANIGANFGGCNMASGVGSVNMGWIGNNAGYTNYIDGSGGMNLGYNEGVNWVTGDGAMNIGYGSGYNVANGIGAMNIGYIAGRNTASGSGAINIGCNNGTTVADGYGAMNIGFNLGSRMASGDGSLTGGDTEVGHGNVAAGLGSWAVGSDVTSSYDYAYVFGQGLAAQRSNSLSCMHLDVKGVPYANQSSFTLYSDVRLKDNVATIGNALDTMLKLRGVTFTYKPTKGLPQGERMGFIAQETEKVMPSWVQDMGDGYKGIGIDGFEALTVEATRELKATVDAQNKEIEQLRREVAELKKMLAR